ncbi:zinc finger protein 507 [Patella vulgata]|uniref:zinc finger protein 507 n=1 Tax=Patella vulgata TaxID=6465 RepID=UPI0021807D54|nr:zinc finger protein 507 [Patella vulgata]
MASSDVNNVSGSENISTVISQPLSEPLAVSQNSPVITVIASQPPESLKTLPVFNIDNNISKDTPVIYIEHINNTILPNFINPKTNEPIYMSDKQRIGSLSSSLNDSQTIIPNITTDLTTSTVDVIIESHPPPSIDHIKTEAEITPTDSYSFKCESCDYSSNNKHYLKQHVDLVHNAGRPYKCPYCDYAGKRNHSLREHLVVHSNERPFECNHCNATFRKKGHLTNHVKLHAMSKVIRCSLCTDIMSDQASFTDHLKSVHKTDQIYACEICDFMTGTESSIKSHMEHHKESRLYQCSLCSFVTKDMNAIGVHLEIHSKVSADKNMPIKTISTNNKPLASLKAQTPVLIKCSECGYTANDRESMKSHMVQHIQSKTSELCTTQSKIIQPVLPQKTSYKCTECAFVSVEATAFIHHMLIHKTEAKKKKEALNVFNIKPISKENTCKTGNAPFIHDERTGRFVCTICGYACEYQRTIKSHIWKHSGNKDIDYPMFQNGPLSVYEENVNRNQLDVGVEQLQEKETTNLTVKDEAKPVEESVPVTTSEPLAKPLQTAQVVLDSKGAICKIKISDGKMVTLMKEIAVPRSNLKLHDFEKMENQKPVFVNSVLQMDPKSVFKVDAKDLAVVVETIKAIPCSQGFTGMNSQQNSPKRANTPNDDSESKKPEFSVGTEREEVEETSEPALTLLSLQKPEPKPDSSPFHNTRSRGQANKRKASNTEEDALEIELPEEEVTTEDKLSVTSKSNTGAGGICSSLLAVIEQLRERSKADIDMENYTKAGIRRTGRKRIRRGSSDDELPTEFVDSIEKITEDGEIRYRCKFCHYSNSKPLLIRIHMRLHKSKKPFECSLCDFIATSIEGLQDHMIQHCKVRTYQCKICPSAFNYKSQLRAHMRAHNEKDPYICDFCDFVTSNISAYRQHVLRHSDTACYSCNNCHKKYSSKNSLIRHECIKISNAIDSLGELDGSSDDETANASKELKCPHCDFCTLDDSEFTSHCVIHTDEEVIQLKCELCDFTAVSNRSLKSHMKRHINDQRYVQQPLEQYKCNLCGYVCHHLPSLKSHMWRHASDRNYSYEFTNDVINAAIDYDIRVDGRDINDPEILERVLNSERKIVEGRLNNTQQPGGEMPVCWVTFRCCQCGFETINKPELNVHMRSHSDIIQQTLDVNKLPGEQENSESQIISSL